MEDSERSKELRFQLSLLFSLDIFTIQLNFLTGGITSWLNALIVGLFLEFLDMVEIFAKYHYQISEFCW